MYASFAGLVFANSNALLEESVEDAQSLKPENEQIQNHAPGNFMGSGFGVRPTGTHNMEGLL